MPGPLSALNKRNFYYASHPLIPQFPPNGLISYFLSLGTDLFAFLPLRFAFSVPSCPVESVSLPLAGIYVLCNCLPDFRLSASVQPPACSLRFPVILISQPPYVQTPGLTTKHRPWIERQEPIFFLLQVQPKALDTSCPLGTDDDFRTPMPNLNIPNTLLAPWPISLPHSALCVRGNAEAFPKASFFLQAERDLA